MYEYQFLVALSTEVSEMRCELHELQIESAKHFILIIVLAISSWVSYRLQKIAIRRTVIDWIHVKSLCTHRKCNYRLVKEKYKFCSLQNAQEWFVIAKSMQSIDMKTESMALKLFILILYKYVISNCERCRLCVIIL